MMRLLEPRFTEHLKSVCHQRLGITPRKVQLIASSHLQQRSIVEMETGEGKTLAVAIAAIAMAEAGHRVYVATANDYLAGRDASDMHPLFDGYGLSTASVTSMMDRESRRKVYSSDIVYGTIRELGFDTLRDQLEVRNGEFAGQIVPAFHSIIVDEADSVLIDEALTPLVISDAGQGLSPATAELFRWSAVQATRCQLGTDYVNHQPTGAIALTDAGIINTLHSSMPATLNEFNTTELLHSLERAIEVATRYVRDVHYIVKGEQAMLVDEYTGRLAEGKKLSGGLHQAIEAKERLPFTSLGRTAARMTIQELVNRVPHLCGVTATAREDKRELRKVYDLSVKQLPPHVPSRRVALAAKVFANQTEKHDGIVAETQAMIATGRAVLIGTRTIEQSVTLSSVMRDHGLQHVVLNARQSSEEASIVALAGQPNRVTVATNMAGRGTDIRLADEVRNAGGLHVIISQPHAAARIDRQLAGRCGRQGDPGTVCQFLAIDDEIFSIALGDHFSVDPNLNLSPQAVLRQARRAQMILSRRHRDQRSQLAKSEAQFGDDLKFLGLDPHLDRVNDQFQN